MPASSQIATMIHGYNDRALRSVVALGAVPARRNSRPTVVTMTPRPSIRYTGRFTVCDGDPCQTVRSPVCCVGDGSGTRSSAVDHNEWSRQWYRGEPDATRRRNVQTAGAIAPAVLPGTSGGL